MDFSPLLIIYRGGFRDVVFNVRLFFLCLAATQLALQVQQERTQVVCSNKEARKRLAEALPQWTLNLKANAYTCSQIKEKQNKTHIKKHGTWYEEHTHETIISFYRLSYLCTIVSLYISLFMNSIMICYAELEKSFLPWDAFKPPAQF